MTDQKFIVQEVRMANFMNWLTNTVHSTVEMTHQEYKNIFNKIKSKADGKTN